MSSPSDPRPTLDLPNLVTLVRVPLAALVWWRPAEPVWLLVLLAAASASDMADGALARWIRRRALTKGGRGRSAGAERVGSWLDPVCDKLFVLSTVIAATVFYAHPWPLPLLLLARELLMVPVVVAHRVSRHRARKVDYTAETVGKATTVLQLAALVGWIFGHPATWWLGLAAAALGVATAFVYVRRGHREVASAAPSDDAHVSGRAPADDDVKPDASPKTT